jgi:hypothetical protein
MSGLFSLIWASAVGVSATKHAIKNSWYKNNSRFTLPNGVEYYYDIDGKCRLLNGTVIMWKKYGEREKVVEVKTNKVVYDAGSEIDKQNAIYEQEAKKKAEADGRLLYIKRNPRCHNLPVFFEFKTGKQLAEIAEVKCLETKEIEYRKWYFYDYLKESLPPGTDLSYGAKVSYDRHRGNGIVITKEEFDKLYEDSLSVKLSDGDYEWNGFLKVGNKLKNKDGIVY